MAYDFSTFKKRITGVEEWLKKELSGIRTGRATIALLDSVTVDVYGAKSPLTQNASITIEDPRTLRIAPWDKSIISAIEKGITLADIGVSTSADSEGMRVIFPDLTSETRLKLVKQAKAKIEEAKVTLRLERSKISKDIDEQEKNAGMPKDDAKRYRDEMQKMVDAASKSFDELGVLKEKEITS